MGSSHNAFTESEKSKIVEVNNTTKINTKSLENMNLGFKKNETINTKDKVFVLSTEEFQKYVTKSKIKAEMVPELLNYFNLTYKERTSVKEEQVITKLFTAYWLRNNGVFDKTAVTVNINGNIDFGGISNHNSAGVRPALWIEL